ncbi:MAG: putative transposase [Lentisphaeria bacterium]|jgi:putative transposase
MRQLNGVYTQTYNRFHVKVGHLFQGRFKAILVEKDSYLLELSRYIVLNPVRAGMVRAVRDWPWSSYRATAGQGKAPACLVTDCLLGSFGRRKSTAIEGYKKFVSDGRGNPSPWSLLRNQVYLGSEGLVDKMQSLIDGDKDLSEIPASQRRPAPKSLDEYKETNQDRNSAIYEAYRSGGYTLNEIAEYHGLHYSTISGIIKNHRSKTSP